MPSFSRIPRRKALGLSLFGFVFGALLAVGAGPEPVSAVPGCKCDDWGVGPYACNEAQNACIIGDDVCEVRCQT